MDYLKAFVANGKLQEILIIASYCMVISYAKFDYILQVGYSVDSLASLTVWRDILGLDRRSDSKDGRSVWSSKRKSAVVIALAVCAGFIALATGPASAVLMLPYITVITPKSVKISRM